MNPKLPLILATGAALALAGCADGTTGQRMSADELTQTQRGVAAGAVLGGVLGATGSGSNRAERAALGAALGAAVGGAVGYQLDAQARELQRDIGGGGTNIVNTGNELIVTMPQDVLFAVDSATLRPDLTADIRTLGASLNRYPDTRVEVIGHTDNTGSAAYNQDLSQRRANAVATVLRNSGVASGRIVTYGRGEDQPIASNLNAEGRAQNRRVEFIIRPN